jgi:branched-chain amino acid transport system ATP-binding protein
VSATAAGATAVGTALLEVRDLHAAYGQVQVLHGLNFSVKEGEVVVILGANGAGKTTTLRAICQMIGTRGSVRVAGREVHGKTTPEVVRAGVAHVPQGRGTFPDLTVIENLEVGAFVRRDRDVKQDIERWCTIFPRLGDRRTQVAGNLSGGEQQMLAVARALMGRPKLLLLDEPSLGLAPMIVQDLFKRLGQINKDEGVTMLIVEQNANLAFEIANHAYVLEAGEIVLSGSSEELRHDDAVRRAYLGY